MKSFQRDAVNGHYREKAEVEVMKGYSKKQLAAHTRGFKEGRERGDIEATLSIAQRMLENGFDVSTVSLNTGVPEGDLEKLFLENDKPVNIKNIHRRNIRFFS